MKEDNTIFYGGTGQECLSFLEFGEIDLKNCKKTVYDFRLHQEAYDWFMLARYINDILVTQKIEKQLIDGSKACQGTFSELHHKNELRLGLGKVAALYAAQSGGGSFFELGQTLFGCIDSMQLALSFLRRVLMVEIPFDLEDITWIGLDISGIFNDISKLLHSQYRVITSDTRSCLPDSCDVFYAKGITLLYAIRDIEQLCKYISSSRCAYFDYSFSLKDEETKSIGTGKSVCYLNFKRFRDSVDSELLGKRIYVNTEVSRILSETNQIWLEFFIGERDCVERFLAFEENVFDLLENAHQSKTYHSMFEKAYHKGWISLDEFIASNKELR